MDFRNTFYYYINLYKNCMKEFLRYITTGCIMSYLNVHEYDLRSVSEGKMDILNKINYKI